MFRRLGLKEKMMGDSKDAVKGSGSKTIRKSGNLVEQVTQLMDDVSICISKKDDDVLAEGEDNKAENIRKVSLLRSAHTLLRATKSLLEDY